MKIAFVDHYRVGNNVHKDTVTIPAAIGAHGHDVTLVSCEPDVVADGDVGPLRLRPLAAVEAAGWTASGYDAAVVTSRLQLGFMPLLRRIKAAGIPLVVKGDTDGTIGYPNVPNYLRTVPVGAHPLNLFRQLKWRLPVRRWVGPKVDQIRLADRFVVESPGAVVNVGRLLRYWGAADAVPRVHFIPNPVAPSVIEGAAPPTTSKRPKVIAAARWDDMLVKGTDLLPGVLRTYLAERPADEVELVGSGAEHLRPALAAGGLAARVTLTGTLPHAELQARIRESRIALVPSRLESYCLVAAEALCAGTSLVVTPIESLVYLAGDGAWGTIAEGFGAPAIAAALLREAAAWEHGARVPHEISAYWRARLAPAVVAREWCSLLDGL